MKILGHRGAREEKPENTLMGFQYALDCGVDGIELDVHLSRDGIPMVIHDSTVDRTANGSGAVLSMSCEELQNLDAGEGQGIPTLEQAVDLIAPHAHLFIEIKAPDLESRVLEILAPYRQKDEPFIVKSFNHRVLQKIRSLDSQIPLAGLLVGIPIDPSHIIKMFKGNMLSISTMTIDEKLVADCHKGGVEVCTWNCNDTSQVEMFRQLGIDWLATDIPSQIKAEL